MSAPAEHTVTLAVAGGLATITLDRPQALNAVDTAMKRELAAILAELPRRTDVRAVLLTGAGRAFCAGGDIVDMEPDAPPDTTRRRMTHLTREVVLPLARLEVPVVAAINGHAHGLGLGLALACDVAFAARGAMLSMAFTRVGLAPDGAVTYFLTRLVGPARAKELLLSGRRLSADEALGLGLVTSVVDDERLLDEARGFARELAEGPTVALGVAKRLVDRALGQSLDDVAQAEAYGQAVAMASADYQEGVRAFREKRPPRFEGN